MFGESIVVQKKNGGFEEGEVHPLLNLSADAATAF